LVSAFEGVPFRPGKPSLVLARTRKGKGVSFMENVAKWHHAVPNDEEFSRAIAELEAAELLAKEGIQCRVLSLHTIKPLDGAAVLKAATETGG
jgi:transketolase